MLESHSSAITSPTRRELATVTCLLALVVLFCFRELVANPTHLLVGAHRGGENDLTAYFLRALDLPGTAIAQGKFPSWNPHLSLGSPTWGNPQSLLFYPPNWLCWWLGSAAASWLLVAHHWWTGVGAYLWARQLGVRHVSALIAGVIGAATPYAIAHTAEGHYPQTCVMAWLPWTLWAFERFLASGGRRWLGVSVCLSLSFLGGHVQESFYLSLLLSGTMTCCLVSRFFSRDAAVRADWARMTWYWSLVGVVTIGLVLVELLPTFGNSQLSVRASGLPLSLAGDGLKLGHWSRLWNPQVESVETSGTSFGSWEFCFHFGIVPALLAVLAMWCGRQRPGTRRLLLMLAVTVLFAFGARSPFFRFCHAWLPGIASFRCPARALYLSSMIIAVLAAIGWDSLWPRLWDARPARRRLAHWASLLVLGLIVWELGTFSARVFATIPPTALRRDSSISKFFRERPSVDRVLSGMGLYDDREAHQDGVQKVLGYEPFMFLRCALFLDALTPDGSKLDPGGFLLPSFRDLHKPLVDLAGVRYAIMPADQPPVAGWKRVATGTVPAEITQPNQLNQTLSFAIFENQTVLPRAFVIGQVTETSNSSQGTKLARLLEQINPRETLLLPQDILPRDSDRTPFAEASIESYSNNEVRVRASSSGHGYLVLTDLFHPGWSATVDGQPTTILPADIAFRAVPLAPGEHSIVFRFVVPGWKAGAIVSALSWLAVSLIALRSSTLIAGRSAKESAQRTSNVCSTNASTST